LQDIARLQLPCQAVVIPSAVGGAPIVLCHAELEVGNSKIFQSDFFSPRSTYRTALEGMSASQIAEALSEQARIPNDGGL